MNYNLFLIMVIDNVQIIRWTNHLSLLFCLFLSFSAVPEHTKSRQSPKSKSHPPFPLPRHTPTHPHTHTQTLTHTVLSNAKEAWSACCPLWQALPLHFRPLRLCPPSFDRLTSPLSTWEPEVTCSPLNPGTPSCPARSRSHKPHSQVNWKEHKQLD